MVEHTWYPNTQEQRQKQEAAWLEANLGYMLRPELGSPMTTLKQETVLETRLLQTCVAQR